jgi:hypothetical protein
MQSKLLPAVIGRADERMSQHPTSEYRTIRRGPITPSLTKHSMADINHYAASVQQIYQNVVDVEEKGSSCLIAFYLNHRNVKFMLITPLQSLQSM